MIVLVQQPCDSVSDMSDSNCRKALLVLNEGFPHLRIAAVNDNVVDCTDCGGGGVGDPHQGIVIKGNYFSFESLYGDCDKTHFVVTFHYNQARRNWYLHRFGRVDYSCQDTTSARVKETRQDVKDYGKVSFADFAGGF